MTNAEYFRATLTDKELADMVSHMIYAHNERLANAFEEWCKESGSTDSNQKQNNPSRFFWQRIFDKETKKWENTARTQNVSVQLFLSMPYKEKYWKRG